MTHKILLVDDNCANLYLLETILKKCGYDVDSAKNGAEALELAKKSPPGLIISDILMPVMDGFVLCQQCKSDERLKQIPFIFYTATYTDPKDEKFALSLGAERFIIKPQEHKELERIVRHVLEDYEKKTLIPSKKPLGEEMEVLRQYNEVLFRKLEKKMVDMEQNTTELKKAEKQIQEQSKALKQKNIALAELLEHVTIEKEELTKKITSNLEKMVIPKLYRLKDKLSLPQKRLFASIEKSIKDISSGFGMKITNKAIALSKRELEICSMIKEGYKNKEIAQELYLSVRTIETIRKNIRKKLKIRNKNVNLESYLKSL